MNIILLTLYIALVLHSLFQTGRSLFLFFKEEPEELVLPERQFYLVFLGWAVLLTPIINFFIN